MKKKAFLLVALMAAVSLSAGARVVTDSIQSKVLGDKVKFNVWLPFGFEMNAEAQYPVLYLLHGFTDTYSAWVEKGRVNEIADELLGTGVLVHQFCHVGSYVMVQGGCRSPKDIPPYIIAAREPIAYCGINLIGLRRRGFSAEQIEKIHTAYRYIYQSGMNVTQALKHIQAEMEITPEVERIIDFINHADRGIIKSDDI